MFLPVTASKVLLLENFVRPTRVTTTGLTLTTAVCHVPWRPSNVHLGLHVGLHGENVHPRTEQMHVHPVLHLHAVSGTIEVRHTSPYCDRHGTNPEDDAEDGCVGSPEGCCVGAGR
jgi:hypothetical protein